MEHVGIVARISPKPEALSRATNGTCGLPQRCPERKMQTRSKREWPEVRLLSFGI